MPELLKKRINLEGLMEGPVREQYEARNLVFNRWAVAEVFVIDSKAGFQVLTPRPGAGLTAARVSRDSAPRVYQFLRRAATSARISDVDEANELIRELSAYRILVPPSNLPQYPKFEYEAATREVSLLFPDGMPAAEDHRESLRVRKYTLVRGVLSGTVLARLQQYYKELTDGGFLRLGDSQSRRFNMHNEPVAKWLHEASHGVVQPLFPEAVKPSYSYLGFYLSGAVLDRHTDREQCEYTLSLTLAANPYQTLEDAWPLYAELGNGEVVEAYLAPGDGLLFKGRELPHYRKRLGDGRTSSSIFLHYVPETFTGPLE